MRTIASANQKGGCGKTTTAINLSYSLAGKDKNVLLIDFDPQAHATMGLGINPSDLETSIYDVLKPWQNRSVVLDDVILSISNNFSLAPSKASLSAVEQELSGINGRENRLLDAIKGLQRTYDYIVIDCPPSIGHLCFNALRACNEAIIPIDLSLFSLRGVSKLQEIVMALKEKVGHEVKSRALITMYDNRTRYSRQIYKKVKEVFQENMYETVIRYNIHLRETSDTGLPIGEFDKNAIGYQDYEELAEEVLRSESTKKDTGVTKEPSSSIYDSINQNMVDTNEDNYSHSAYILKEN